MRKYFFKNSKKILISFLMIFGFTTISSYGNNNQNGSTRNSIVFLKIDNQAYVYVNDELVFDSGLVEGDPELNLEVGLNDYLTNENNTIKIVLYNSPCDNCMTNPWSVSYEIYEDGEFVDYVYESEDGKGVGGEVYSVSFDWGDF